MGCIHQNLLAGLVMSLASDHGLNTCVETGTHHGDASALSAGVLSAVTTAEVSHEFHRQAQSRDHLQDTGFRIGDSAREIERIVPELTTPALFWLDAHAGGGYCGSEDRRLLIDELRAINRSSLESFILIYDIRGFVAPPPPFDWQRLPSIDEVIVALKSHYYVVIIHDTSIVAPRAAQQLIVKYFHWLRQKIRAYMQPVTCTVTG